jgi:UDPglucose--hexose-1-phosphate uridylyltransferase
MPPDDVTELLDIQGRVLGALDSVFGDDVPYVAGFIQAPVRQFRDVAHMYVEVLSPRRAADKLKYLAGSESVAGAFINDVSPEHAADILRAAIAHDGGG